MTVATALWLSGCSRDTDPNEIASPSASPAPERQVIARWYTSDHVARGEEVFQTNCASCHGASAQGAENWRRRGPDGKFPPPPLNGTAHAWHHPMAQLKHTIKEGSPPNVGNMPGWKGVLTDAEVVAVIAWFQSLWPDEVYAAWLEMDASARRAVDTGDS